MKDKYDLERFIKAQDKCFNNVLQELKNKKKETHWMWFVFPQIIGLGKSEISKYYAIKSIEEVQEYMNNEILQRRMNEVCSILLNHNTNNPLDIFETIDSVKLKSCMTLFNEICSNNHIFINVLNKYYEGKKDISTIAILSRIEKY